MPIKHLSYRVIEAAKMLDVSDATIRRLMAERGVEPARLPTDRITRPAVSIEQIMQLADAKHQRRRQKRTGPVVMSVYLPKGGAGKSTLTRELTAEFTLQGLRVLCIDNDDQASLSLMMGYQPDALPGEDVADDWSISANLMHAFYQAAPFDHVLTLSEIVKKPFGEHGPWLVPADITLGQLPHLVASNSGREQILRRWFTKLAKNGELNDIDVILIDNAPSTGTLSRAAIVAADMLLVPVRLDALSLKSIRFLATEMANLSDAGLSVPPVVAVPNYFKSHSMRSTKVLEALQRDLGEEVPIAPHISYTDKISDAMGDPKVTENTTDEMLPIAFQHRNRNYERLQDEIRRIGRFLLEQASRNPPWLESAMDASVRGAATPTRAAGALAAERAPAA